MNASIPNGYPNAQPFATATYPGLAGKIVLNTGAGSGIGRAMAHAFARHGAKLMLLGIDATGLEQTISYPKAATREHRLLVVKSHSQS